MWDRTTRNFSDYEILEDLIRRDDLVLHVAQERWQLHADSGEGEWLKAELNTLVAKTYSRQLSRRAKESATAKAENGWYPGRPSLGYRNKKALNASGGVKDRGGTIELTTEGKALVKRMAELRISGHSFECIAKLVVGEGLWEAAGYKPTTAAGSRIHRVLNDEFYIGWFTWAGDRYLGKHEHAFTLSEWARLQAAMDTTVYGKNIEPRGAFVGFMTCAECGCRITYDPKTKPNGKRYEYYRCSNGRRVHAKHKYVHEKDIFAQFEKSIEDISINHDLLDDVMVALEESHEAMKAERRVESAEFRSAILAVDDHEAKLTDAMLSGRIDDDTYRRQQQRLRSERLVLVDKVAAAHEALDDRYLVVARRIIELAKSVKSQWEVASPMERRDLLDLILSNPSLDGVTLDYEMRKPFAILVEMAKGYEWRALSDSNARPSGSKNGVYPVISVT